MPAILRPRRHKLNCRSLANMDPNHDLPQPPPPPPPVILLHVVSVTDAGSNLSRWLFDLDIAAPVGWLPTLAVNGVSPVGVARPGPRTLELAYPLLVAGGTWNCPADAVGIESVDGHKQSHSHVPAFPGSVPAS